MKLSIAGAIAQHARLEFDPGDSCWASSGSLISYTAGIEWRLRMPGGLGGAIKRKLAGEGGALTFVETRSRGEVVHLGSNHPGHLDTWDLARGPIVATRGSFIAAWGDDIDITITMARRAGAMFFGGAGLFLQKVSGRGTALIHASGDFIRRDLADREVLLVSSGNLAAFSADIDYSIQGVGGCVKALFGAEGLFMTRLTGPGTVYLQTLKRGFHARAAAAAAAG